ncbi:hypothetical protein HPG69_008730 [Diceros bicornis minor]|uniref:Uncharacterized protein n=1 Tax=Diceros bicornis minor TaxID=77932 RepID=A0A7J7FBG6_DICBM|nr:hypothetical protein HPG69_008730 [Diceros bicornis minor]
MSLKPTTCAKQSQEANVIHAPGPLTSGSTAQYKSGSYGASSVYININGPKTAPPLVKRGEKSAGFRKRDGYQFRISQIKNV